MKKMVYKQLLEKIRLKASFFEEVDDEIIRKLIDETILEKGEEVFISINDRVALRIKLFNAIRRLDILQPLVEDDSISEIMINGKNDIFIERGGRVTKLDYGFESSEQLENVIQIIVSQVNRTVNESVPIVDARLKNGSRVNVVLPPISLSGPIVTIRKFPENPLTYEQLIKTSTITRQALDFLIESVRKKLNIFISGGTSSGKTTFLNVLSNAIPSDERIITIEDSAELNISGVDNLVRLETRNVNVENKGEVSIRDLIRSSLRMRPDRIIVGEIRGEEALDMLQAMNTGHDGSLSTGHANSSKDMITRIETMVLMGANIPLPAIRQMIASAIDIIVHLSRKENMKRQVVQINEVIGVKAGEVALNPIFELEGEELVKCGDIKTKRSNK